MQVRGVMFEHNFEGRSCFKLQCFHQWSVQNADCRLGIKCRLRIETLFSPDI